MVNGTQSQIILDRSQKKLQSSSEMFAEIPSMQSLVQAPFKKKLWIFTAVALVCKRFTFKTLKTYIYVAGFISCNYNLVRM